MKWIADQQTLNDALTRLSSEPMVAIDTEADSLHSYFDKVCLIQMSSPGEDLIIDPLAAIELAPLAPLLENRDIIKVFHAADYDLRILNRDFGFTVHNLFDTMISAQLLGMPQIGLAALLKKYFNLDTDKSHQRADWAMRPLSPQMLKYAATDTHYLIELAAILRGELEAKGRWEWAQEEFERLEQIRHREADETEERFRRMKNIGKLSRRELGAVAALYEWRDGIARRLDRPPFKVATNELMVSIAQALPSSLDELERVKGMPMIVIRKYGNDIVACLAPVITAGEDDLPEKVSSRPWMRDLDLERRVERLKKVRDTFASELGIDSSIIAPKHVLVAAASMANPSMEELEGIAALRNWQRNLIGERLIEVLNG